jgi:hypothetical protein
VAVSQGETVTVSIAFSASFGTIITVYTAGSPGGTFVATNNCSAAVSTSSTSGGLRAVVSGWSN